MNSDETACLRRALADVTKLGTALLSSDASHQQLVSTGSENSSSSVSRPVAIGLMRTAHAAGRVSILARRLYHLQPFANPASAFVTSIA